MNLFSNLIWKNKRKPDRVDVYWQDIYTKIIDNWNESQKYFDKLDISQQIKFKSIFSNNKDYFSKNIQLNDIEKYFNSLYSEFDRDILNDFYVRRKNQQWTNVDDLFFDFKQYVSFQDFSEKPVEDYLELIYAIDQIAFEKEYFETYLYSTAVLRYLRTDTYKESPKQKDLYRSIPSWFIVHMYFDLIFTIKKGVDNNLVINSIIKHLFNININGKKTLLRPLAILN